MSGKKRKKKTQYQKRRRAKAYLARFIFVAGIILVLFLCFFAVRGIIRLTRSGDKAEEKASETRIAAGSGAPHRDTTEDKEAGGKTEEELREMLFGTADQRLLELKKNGRVIETLTDSFDSSVYDEEGFRDMVTKEMDDYNVSSPGGVTLKKLTFSDGGVTLIREYASAKDYALYNSLTLRVGDVKSIGTVDTGVTKLSDGTKIPASEIKELKGTAVILNFAATVETPKNIKYASSSVTITAKDTAKTGRGEESAVLIY